MTVLGINLPWFAGAYGHDLAENLAHPGWPAEATPEIIRGTLSRCRELELDAVRFWLCEHGEGVLHEDGVATGVMPSLLRNLALIQDCAAALGLRIYPSLLDANSWNRDGDVLLERLAVDGDARQRFAEHVVAPIARALDPKLTIALEIMNEPEQMTPEGAGARGKPWSAIGAMLSSVREAARAERPSLLLSASGQHGIVPRLHAAAPFLDLIDLHRYCDNGSLPPLPDLGLPAGVPVLAGECGVALAPTDDAEDAIDHFVWNAQRWGYLGVFLWRLEGSHGLLRPTGHWRTRAHKLIAAIRGVR